MNDVIGPVDYGTLSYRCERGRYFAGNFSSVFGWYSFEFEWKNLKKKNQTRHDCALCKGTS